ncbi:hypothetical protein BT69DRAFT_1317532 [Atractiella rhizophila]|nr:hypothetical protein BT69DRAFT_1317532 [Atractiella rhizophila]
MVAFKSPPGSFSSFFAREASLRSSGIKAFAAGRGRRGRGGRFRREDEEDDWVLPLASISMQGAAGAKATISLQVAQGDPSTKIGCTKHKSKQCWSTSHRQLLTPPIAFKRASISQSTNPVLDIKITSLQPKTHFFHPALKGTSNTLTLSTSNPASFFQSETSSNPLVDVSHRVVGPELGDFLRGGDA